MKTFSDDFVFADQPVISNNGELLRGPLTKREYFATLAMQSIQAAVLAEEHLPGVTTQSLYLAIGELAVLQADALIEALNQSEKEGVNTP